MNKDLKSRVWHFLVLENDVTSLANLRLSDIPGVVSTFRCFCPDHGYYYCLLRFFHLKSFDDVNSLISNFKAFNLFPCNDYYYCCHYYQDRYMTCHE